MFLMHYIIPLIIFYFYRDKIILAGLILGNLVDLDHIYSRITGQVPWFSSACQQLGNQCSFGIYPLHNPTFAMLLILPSALILAKGKNKKFIGWLSVGILLNLALDYIHLITGFGI